MMCSQTTKNNQPVVLRAATIAEISRMAGVGTATVDRVLNNRPHVRETTRQRVMQAKAAIEKGYQTRTRLRPWRLKVILPGDSGATTDYLAEAIQELGEYGNATIECVFVPKMDPAQLARKLTACSGQGIDAVIFQALDHPRIADAVQELSRDNIPCATIMSGLTSPDIVAATALDNRAAGRTAGYMMGRLIHQPGSVAIVTGGELYRVHQDREIGFRAAIRHGFPHITDILTLNGHDEKADNFDVVSSALESCPDLLGIYNVGGGNSGIARALQAAHATNRVVFIGHHLTRNSKLYLLDGTMDIVLHMNIAVAARQIVELTIANLERRESQAPPLHIEVVTRENLIGIRPNE